MPAGRPTEFKQEYIEAARLMCEQGATDADLANNFGVNLSTISLWKSRHKEFLDALKAGKAVADDRVEASLYQRAMGYECDETDIRVIEGKLVMTPIRKVYPPDTTAMIFWLKNRRRDQWRDRVDSEITGKDGGPIQQVTTVTGLPDAMSLLGKVRGSA